MRLATLRITTWEETSTYRVSGMVVIWVYSVCVCVCVCVCVFACVCVCVRAWAAQPRCQVEQPIVTCWGQNTHTIATWSCAAPRKFRRGGASSRRLLHGPKPGLLRRWPCMQQFSNPPTHCSVHSRRTVRPTAQHCSGLQGRITEATRLGKERRRTLPCTGDRSCNGSCPVEGSIAHQMIMCTRSVGAARAVTCLCVLPYLLCMRVGRPWISKLALLGCTQIASPSRNIHSNTLPTRLCTQYSSWLEVGTATQRLLLRLLLRAQR